MEWKSIAIPKRMYERIATVIPFTAHTSVSEYVREKVNRHLAADLNKAEQFKERMEELKELE